MNHTSVVRVLEIGCLLASLGCIQVKHPVRFLPEAKNAVSGTTMEVNATGFDDELLLQSRDYGLLTDWRVLGPFGTGGSRDFDRIWQPERQVKAGKLGLANSNLFEFADGAVRLRNESEPGIYYAESVFKIACTGTWKIRLQTLGTLELFVDGKSALRNDRRSTTLPEVSWNSLELDAGKHQVLVKFLPSALPFRVAVLPPSPGPKSRPSPKAIHAEPESGYQNASVKVVPHDTEL